MNMWQILFDDEGEISRREWWAGTLVLLALQAAGGWLATRYLSSLGVDRAVALFVAIVILIPFHSVNAKRLQAIGQPRWLALAAGGVALASILAGAFLPGHPVNIPLGLALLVVIVPGAAGLGFYDPPPRVNPDALTLPPGGRSGPA